MKRKLRRLALVSLIWLTAASTLFASLPHIECRCPDGRLKLICLTSLVAPSACCCNATCCDEANPAQPAPGQGCCCKKRHTAKPVVGPVQQACASDATAPAEAPHAKRDGCTKQLVQPGLAVLTYTEAVSTAHLDLPHVDLHIPPLAKTAALAQRAHANPFASRFQHAPAPPDLVVVLQHFLI